MILQLPSTGDQPRTAGLREGDQVLPSSKRLRLYKAGASTNSATLRTVLEVGLEPTLPFRRTRSLVWRVYQFPHSSVQVPVEGFEPSTLGLRVPCSNQLSYTGDCEGPSPPRDSFMTRVLQPGLEPGRLSAGHFECPASTNSAIGAGSWRTLRRCWRRFATCYF